MAEIPDPQSPPAQPVERLRLRPFSETRPHLAALDGLRGLAILLVMFYHYLTQLGSTAPVLREFLGLIHSGWIGVDLFFLLSGFLITGILADTREKKRYFVNFYARRTLRIFPLYYAVLTLVLLLLPRMIRSLQTPQLQSLQREQAWLWSYASNLAIGAREDFCFNRGWIVLGHFWSLAMEEQFYLLWPALIYLLPRRRAMGSCVLLLLIALASRLYLISRGDHPVGVYVWPICRLDALVVGAWLALAARGEGGLARLQRPARWVALGSGLLLVKNFWPHRALENHLPEMMGLGLVALALFFGWVLIEAILASPQDLAGRLWRWGFLASLGKYSYGLYVFHELLRPLYEALFGVDRLRPILHSFRLSVAVYGLLAIGSSWGVAWVSYHGFECRFLKLKRYFEPDRIS